VRFALFCGYINLWEGSYESGGDEKKGSRAIYETVPLKPGNPGRWPGKAEYGE
jgi:hypothetical protein